MISVHGKRYSFLPAGNVFDLNELVAMQKYRLLTNNKKKKFM